MERTGRLIIVVEAHDDTLAVVTSALRTDEGVLACLLKIPAFVFGTPSMTGWLRLWLCHLYLGQFAVASSPDNLNHVDPCRYFGSHLPSSL